MLRYLPVPRQRDISDGGVRDIGLDLHTLSANGHSTETILKLPYDVVREKKHITFNRELRVEN